MRNDSDPPADAGPKTRTRIFELKDQDIMTKEEIKKGRKVWYRSFEGATQKPAEIVSDEVRNVCGTDCAFIDICSGCVDIEFLFPRD